MILPSVWQLIMCCLEVALPLILRNVTYVCLTPFSHWTRIYFSLSWVFWLAEVQLILTGLSWAPGSRLGSGLLYRALFSLDQQLFRVYSYLGEWKEYKRASQPSTHIWGFCLVMPFFVKQRKPDISRVRDRSFSSHGKAYKLYGKWWDAQP